MSLATLNDVRQPSMLRDANPWRATRDGDLTVRDIFDRHYSRRRYRDGRRPKKFVGPGEHMVLISDDGLAIWVWRKFRSDDGQEGVNCAVFRNEGCRRCRSSDLVRFARQMAWQRWPGERLYTYVDPHEVQSGNPGYCFKQDGWVVCGETAGGLVILERTAAYRQGLAA